jgi:hypothetical protein
MTRNGKIARLPKHVREALNQRLQDGQSGPGLLHWLNTLPECREMLAEQFDSHPITKQNLSEWRQGGYEEWLRKEESRRRVQMLMEKAGDLEDDAEGMTIADRLGTVLAAELVAAAEQLNEIADPKERWTRLKDILRELYRLRREDHHARKLRMAEDKSERDAKEYEQRQQQMKVKEELDLFKSIHNRRALAESLGGGEYGEKWAEWTINMKHGLPMHKWEKKYPKGTLGAVHGPDDASAEGKSRDRRETQGKLEKPKAVTAGQSKSESVQASPSQSNQLN